MNEANRMNTPYWNDSEVRKQIDDVLRACAGRFAALGQDSTKAEREAAKVQERKELRSVKHLDPVTVKIMLID